MNPGDDFALRFFALVSEIDCQEAAFWQRNPDGWLLGITCNDVFAWGYADFESVETEADLAALRQAFEDSAPYGDILYCARRRGMRPQGAFYPAGDRSIGPLFDACGPPRATGFGNPYEPFAYRPKHWGKWWRRWYRVSGWVRGMFRKAATQ